MTTPKQGEAAPRTVLERCGRVGMAGVTVALLLTSIGCEGTGADSTPPSIGIRDSAGVQIVENHGHGWTEGDYWRLGEVPDIDIGVVEGDSVYQLFHVVGATRIADGGVAVALAGSNQIRIYGPDGIFRRTVGRTGEGPGEFKQLTGIWSFRGDSLVAWDAVLRRVTFMDSTGSFARQAVLQANPSNPSLLRPLADGRLALVDHRFNFAATGMQDQVMEVTLHAPTGDLEDSIGTFLFARMGPVSAEGASRMGSPIFSPRTDIAAAAQAIVLGPGSAAEFLQYEPGGRLAQITRWPDADRNVEKADVDLYREERVAAVDDENRQRAERAYLSAIPYEQTFPAYDRVLPSADGGVWIRAFRRPGETGPRKWLVIDADGLLLGSVTVPSQLWPFEIGADYVLGVERDDLDVERVRLYRVLKE